LVRTWTRNNNEGPLKLLQSLDNTRGVVVLKSLKDILVCGCSGCFNSWDLSTGTLIKKFRREDKYMRVEQVQILDENTVIFGATDNKIRLWDLRSSTVVETYKGGRSIFDLVVDPESYMMASCTTDFLKIWDIRINTAIVEHECRDYEFTSLAFDPLKQMVIAGTANTAKKPGLYKWNFYDKEPVLLDKEHSGSITNIIYDRQKLITGGKDSKIILRDYNGGNPVVIQTESIPENTIVKVKVTDSEVYASGGTGNLMKLSLNSSNTTDSGCTIQ